MADSSLNQLRRGSATSGNLPAQVSRPSALSAVENGVKYGARPGLFLPHESNSLPNQHLGRLKAEAPATSDFLSQSPEHQAAFKSDAESMGFFERYVESTVNLMHAADIRHSMAKMGLKALGENLTEEERVQARNWRQSLRDIESGPKPPKGMLNSIAETVATVSSSGYDILNTTLGAFPEIAGTVAVGAGAGASVGSFVPGPGTLAGAISGGSLALGKGAAAFIPLEFGKQRMGFGMIEDMLDAEEKDSSLDFQHSAMTNGLAGMAHTAIFGLGLKLPAAVMRGSVRTISTKVGQNLALRQAILSVGGAATGTAQKILGSTGTKLLTGTAHTTAAVAFMGANTHVADKIAGAASKVITSGGTGEDALKAAVDTATDSDTWKEGLAVAKDSLKVGVGLGLGFTTVFGLGPRLISRKMALAGAERDIKSAKSANNMVALTALSKNLSDATRLAPRSIEAYVKKVYDKSGIKDPKVYIDVDDWNAYFVSKNIDPRTAAGDLMSDITQYESAAKSGAPLEIPTEVYVSRLGNSEHADFFTVNARTELRASSIKKMQEEHRTSKELAKDLLEKEVQDGIVIKPPEDLRGKMAEEASMKVEGEKATLPTDPGTEITTGLSLEKLTEAFKSEKDAQAYLDANEALKKSGTELSVRRVKERIKDLEREIESRVKEEQQGVLNQLDFDPDYVAFERMAKGKLPSGDPLPEGMRVFKLDRREIAAEFGEEFANRVPKAVTNKTSRNTASLIDAAAELGYDSTAEMLAALVQKGDPRSASRLAAERIVDASGKPPIYDALVSDGWAALTDRQLNSRRNIEQWNVLAKVHDRALRAATREGPRIVRRLKTDEFYREAQNIAEDTVVRQLKSESYKNLLAQRAESKKWGEALSKGKLEDAIDAKEKETVASIRHEVIEKLQTDINKSAKEAVNLMKESRQRTAGRAGSEYIDAANQTLRQVGISKAKPQSKGFTMDAALESIKKETGVPLEVPESLKEIGRFIDFRDAPAGAVLDAVNFAKEIHHLAKNIDKVKADGRQISIRRYVRNMVRSVNENFGAKIELDEMFNVVGKGPEFAVDKTFGKSIEDVWDKTRSSLEISDFTLKKLDGGNPDGLMQRTFRKPFVEAEVKKANVIKSYGGDVARSFSKNLTKKEMQNLRSLKEPYAVFVEGIGKKLTLEERIGFALHQGNSHNKLAVRKGRGLTQKQVNDIVDTLEKRHWDAVSSVWKSHKNPFEMGFEMERRATGRTVIPVEPEKVRTKFGERDGGYMPIDYEQSFSKRVSDLSPTDEMFGYYGFRKMTKQNHQKPRKGVPKNAQARIDLAVLTEHVENVAHDLAYREPILNAWKILGNEQVASILDQVGGKPLVRQLQNWVEAVATNRDPTPTTWVGKSFRKIRKGATVNALLWNASSLTAQISGLPIAMKEVGAKWITQAISDQFKETMRTGDLSAFYDAMTFAQEKSPEMKARLLGSFDREIKDMSRDLGNIGSKEFLVNIKGTNKEALRSFFAFAGLGQSLIDTVVWHGAYKKAMTGSQKGIKFGDEPASIRYALDAVERSQGTGRLEFLPEAMRTGGELNRMFFMFYTPLAAQLNQFMAVFSEISRKKRTGQIGPKDIATATAGLIATGVLPGVLYLMARGELDEPKDAALAPLEMVPYLREIPGMVEYNKELSAPAFKLTSDAVRQSEKLAKLMFGKDIPRRRGGRGRSRRKEPQLTGHDIRRILNIVGTSTGLPGNAFGKPLSFAWEYMNDRTRKMSNSEAVYTAIFKGASRRTRKEKQPRRRR